MPSARRSRENPAAENTFHEKLQAFRVQRDLTYKQLGVLIGVTEETARRACLGKKLTIRIAAKVERILVQVNGNGGGARE